MAGQNRYNFTSPGADATDALTQFLAVREAEKRQKILDALQVQDRAERERHAVASEEFQRQQLGETVKYREANQQALDEQRLASADASRATGEERTAKTAAAADLKARLEAIVADPNADPNVRRAAQFKLLDITPTADVQTGRNHGQEALDRSQATLNNALTLMAKRDQYSDENRVVKPTDDKNLPNGVKAYADSLVQRHKGNAVAALDEMRANMGNVRTAHPNVSLAAISNYIRSSSLKGDEEAPSGTSGFTVVEKK